MLNARAFVGICRKLVADWDESQVPAAPGCRVHGYLSRKQKVQSHDKRGKTEPLGARRGSSGAWEWPDVPARVETD